MSPHLFIFATANNVHHRTTKQNNALILLRTTTSGDPVPVELYLQPLVQSPFFSLVPNFQFGQCFNYSR